MADDRKLQITLDLIAKSAGIKTVTSGVVGLGQTVESMAKRFNVSTNTMASQLDAISKHATASSTVVGTSYAQATKRIITGISSLGQNYDLVIQKAQQFGLVSSNLLPQKTFDALTQRLKAVNMEFIQLGSRTAVIDTMTGKVMSAERAFHLLSGGLEQATRVMIGFDQSTYGKGLVYLQTAAMKLGIPLQQLISQMQQLGVAIRVTANGGVVAFNQLTGQMMGTRRFMMTLRNSTRKFRMELLSLMFGFMMLNRYIMAFFRSAITTYERVTNKQGEFTKQTNKLSAAWEFLKFRIIAALSQSPLFKKMIDMLITFINWLSRMPVHVLEKIAFWLGVIGAITGVGMILASLLLLLDGLKKIFGGAILAGLRALRKVLSKLGIGKDATKKLKDFEEKLEDLGRNGLRKDIDSLDKALNKLNDSITRKGIKNVDDMEDEIAELASHSRSLEDIADSLDDIDGDRNVVININEDDDGLAGGVLDSLDFLDGKKKKKKSITKSLDFILDIGKWIGVWKAGAYMSGSGAASGSLGGLLAAIGVGITGALAAFAGSAFAPVLIPIAAFLAIDWMLDYEDASDEEIAKLAQSAIAPSGTIKHPINLEPIVEIDWDKISSQMEGTDSKFIEISSSYLNDAAGATAAIKSNIEGINWSGFKLPEGVSSSINDTKTAFSNLTTSGVIDAATGELSDWTDEAWDAINPLEPLVGNSLVPDLNKEFAKTPPIINGATGSLNGLTSQVLLLNSAMENTDYTTTLLADAAERVVKFADEVENQFAPALSATATALYGPEGFVPAAQAASTQMGLLGDATYNTAIFTGNFNDLLIGMHSSTLPLFSKELYISTEQIGDNADAFKTAASKANDYLTALQNIREELGKGEH